jgi:hypothetical protein
LIVLDFTWFLFLLFFDLAELHCISGLWDHVGFREGILRPKLVLLRLFLWWSDLGLGGLNLVFRSVHG